ncbi:hypothetical protein YQE_11435, partial [Dendroctonus ponderosae]
MSRLNGRLASAPPQDPNQGFEPSCLVRTPSGNVYIPSGTLIQYFYREQKCMICADKIKLEFVDAYN